jgi:hypothetical protein
LYEKGNEELLEEQFLDENPSLSKKDVKKSDSEESALVSKEDVKKSDSEESALVSKEDVKKNDMKESRLVSKEDVKKNDIEKIKPNVTTNIFSNNAEKSSILSSELTNDKISTEGEEIDFEKDQQANDSESIIKSVHTACSVLKEISKYLHSNQNHSDLNLKIQKNIKNIFKKYYKEIVNSHEYATEFVGYIQDDIRTSRLKGNSYFFNSFQSNMLLYSGKGRTKLIENSRPLHFKENYMTYLDNFTMFLYGPFRKTPLNGLQIDVTFHFFQNKDTVKYFSYTAENIKFKHQDENKKSVALSTVTLPIEKIISKNSEAEITMIPTINVKNRSVHILSLDISLKLLLSYRLESNLEGNFLLQSE